MSGTKRKKRLLLHKNVDCDVMIKISDEMRISVCEKRANKNLQEMWG